MVYFILKNEKGARINYGVFLSLKDDQAKMNGYFCLTNGFLFFEKIMVILGSSLVHYYILKKLSIFDCELFLIIYDAYLQSGAYCANRNWFGICYYIR